MNDIFIRLVDLDPSIKGFVKVDQNCDYNIYINARLCLEAQKKAFQHELEHIRLDHLHSDRPVAELEAEVFNK